MSRDVCGRGWLFGDEPCSECNEPVRTHTHYAGGPRVPVRKVYYDEVIRIQSLFDSTVGIEFENE